MNIRKITLLAAVAVAAVLSCGVRGVAAVRGESSITPERLTCEYAADPLIDVSQPRLAWINMNGRDVRGAAQTAYRIRVALSETGFDSAVWDSGRVESSESAFIPYGGPLASRTSYWWQVMVWDEQGRASEWSAPAHWHTGLLSKDEWRGEWIGAPWQGEES